MRTDIGGGRLFTLYFDDGDQMNVNGTQYETHCSLEFWNRDDLAGQEVCIFASREKLKGMAEKILRTIQESEGQ